MPPLSPSLTFATTRLGLTPWPGLASIFEAYDNKHRKILVRSGNGLGKTAALAALCNYVLSSSPDSLVLTTASSWVQVRRSLWGEIRSQARKGGLYGESKLSQTSIELSDKHYAIGISPDVPENAQGFHAPTMLIAVDEATGVDRETMDALLGNATGANCTVVLIYNPINKNSYPYDCEQSGDWFQITLSALDHPNVTTGRDRIPGAVTRQWIEDRCRAWSFEVPSEESASICLPWTGLSYRITPRVAARILGVWPDGDGESFIEEALVLRSYSVEATRGRRVVGCDVARSGEDKTVFAFFDGDVQEPFQSFTGRDLMRTADRLNALSQEGWLIGLDDTGLGGGVSDRLRQLGANYIPINFGSSAKQFFPFRRLANARAEMYFVVEQELRQKALCLLPDAELVQELTAPNLLEDPGSGGFLLSPKAGIRKALGRSPDKADAVCIARYTKRLYEYYHRAYRL